MSPQSTEPIDAFYSALGGRLAFGPEPTLGLSAYYSRIAVNWCRNPAQLQVWFAYNRQPALVIPNLAENESTVTNQECSPSGIVRERNAESGPFRETITLSDSDVIRYEVSGSEKGFPGTVGIVTALTPDHGFPWSIQHGGEHELIIEGRKARTDGRDPEPSNPFHMVIHFSGEVTAKITADGRPILQLRDGSSHTAVLHTPGSIEWEFRGPGRVDMGFGMGGDPLGETQQKVRNAAKAGTETCMKSLKNWWAEALGQFSPEAFGSDPGRQAMACKAVLGLLSNVCRPHDAFAPFHSCFPNRCHYSSHYLWDACFQNLALIRFRPDLAMEALLLLIHRQEESGKIPQFSCATWNRPGASQPPLIGWAAWFVYQKTGERGFLDTIYSGLKRNMTWWDRERKSGKSGLYEYDEAVESGWDDSPRWDHGKIKPLDLNSFLVSNLRNMACMALELGIDSESEQWNRKADSLADVMVKCMYNREKHLFFDLKVDSLKPLDLVTPAAFLPFWVGVPLPEEEVRTSIRDHLLNPIELFGKYPFPVVAYNDSRYQGGKWWRGPVWPNIAWLMTEVLRMHGFEAEWREAVTRLCAMILQNEEPSELYNSETGVAQGVKQCGWGCSVAYDLLGKGLAF